MTRLLWQSYKKSKFIYIHFKLADLTNNHQYKIDYKDKTDSNLNFPKFSYNTRDKVLRRINIYWHHKKCTQSTFSIPKAMTQIGTDDWTNTIAKDKRKVVI